MNQKERLLQLLYPPRIKLIAGAKLDLELTIELTVTLAAPANACRHKITSLVRNPKYQTMTLSGRVLSEVLSSSVNLRLYLLVSYSSICPGS